MGQLEKYGLYVLCLVIFLILGVALWGDPAGAAERGAKPGAQQQAQAPKGAAPAYDLNDFKQLMSSAPKPSGTKAPGESTDGKGSPAKGSKGAEPGKDVGKDIGRDSGKAPDGERTRPADGGANDRGKAPGSSGADPKGAARPTYQVVAHDTLGEIAQKQLGSVAFLPLLQQLNPKVTPRTLRAGQTLVLPSKDELAAAKKPAAATAPKADDRADGKADGKVDARLAAQKPATGTRTHEIKLGDTFEGLAKKYFGSASRVEDIKKLNPSVDPARLRTGQVIRLPD